MRFWRSYSPRFRLGEHYRSERRIRPRHGEFVQEANFGGSEDERGDAEVEGESDEVSYGKCHWTGGDLRVEFQ